MFKFKKTDWNIVASDGGTATVGTPIVKLQVGGGYIRVPVRKNDAKNDIMLRGPGVGAVVGVGVEPPWKWGNVSGATSFLPSGGIGPIYGKVGAPKTGYNKLTGNFVVLAATGAANLNGLTGCMGIWLHDSLVDCPKDTLSCNLQGQIVDDVLSMAPGGASALLLAKAHAIGFFWGMLFTTDPLSASASLFEYLLSAA